MNRIQKGSLAIDHKLYDFIANEVMPVVGLDNEQYWQDFERIVKKYTPINRELLAKRDEIQAKIDEWHAKNPTKDGQFDKKAYTQFLQDLGYIVPVGDDFSITTENVDDEIATIAGPQLVVPVRNARYALNAANARWGSLYDALYGTDVIDETDGAEKGNSYNPKRGAKVIDFAKQFLTNNFALLDANYSQVTGFAVDNGQLMVNIGEKTTKLQNPEKFVGFVGDTANPSAILLKNNGLHVEIQIDKNSPIGKDDPAGIKDVLLEAAVTTIQDCEDSVAAVDAGEKTEVYRNWFGLMKGDLTDTFVKNGKTMTRTMNSDREYTAPDGKTLTLHGRSVMLLRNVGHLMTNPAILVDGEEIFEGIMDTLMTALCSLPDLLNKNSLKNSRTGSMYIVKPKMHGPDEVAFTVALFGDVEQALNLPNNTLKVGIMDEERRTTVNLKECIRKAKERTIFINTGFMDRTGDEMHTSMQAGAFVRKNDMKHEDWLNAYERWNVDVGVACGLRGKAQIGKGMWAKPDSMKEMLATKSNHPKSGATCAWVPSPTGATLHAIHYHETDVMDVLDSIKTRTPATLDDLLSIPLATTTDWTQDEKTKELENNCQGILGYVVRWVDQGIGCSKVPDIDNVGLMEDRATLRISSQHVANWLEHGVVSREQVLDVLKRMAKIVDAQNADDPNYTRMSDSCDTLAFNCACDLIFQGAKQPSGYTEPLLHKARLDLKSRL
ncbi:malate synthase G [Moraxella macacae 0408225]|uniref:Malate synthase G n=2 Tax=Moraxella macacae TaxID=765840 RepID=L2F727_9GAMM|nr:malate synthase G [Moraxella macacae 0408225]